MNPLSTKGDLLRYLDQCAVDYSKEAPTSLTRNGHLTGLGKRAVSQQVIDAVLVDFINWIGVQQGIDYAMNARDLRQESGQLQEILARTLDRPAQI